MKRKQNKKKVSDESDESIKQGLEKIFSINSDPYKIWKCISDLKGNS